MGRRRSWVVVIGAVVGALLLPSVPSSFASPVCELQTALAFPTGVAPAERATLDRDGDGLVDAAERELAACVVPQYHFDSDEPALRGAGAREPMEPVVLYAVYPDGLSPTTGLLRIRITFVELFARDGGFIYCNFPEPNGCNSHRGDAQVREVVVEATAVTRARIVYAAGCDGFASTHVKLYASWGKHHGYCQPYVCDDPRHFDACDCGHPACGLGHWDRADGKGAIRMPEVTESQNVGQREEFDVASRPAPARTPRGFANALAAFGFPGEYVYDACRGRTCDVGAPWWKSFLDGRAWMDAPVMSLYRAILKPSPDQPIGLRSDHGTCRYGLVDPRQREDVLGDCDPCPGGNCACFADGREQLLALGVGTPLRDDDWDPELRSRGPELARAICSIDDDADAPLVPQYAAAQGG